MAEENKIMKDKEIILLGATGFVGTNVAGIFKEAGIEFTGLSRAAGLDLREYDSVLDVFSSIKPDWIINCAAHVGSLNYVSQQAADVMEDNAVMILNMYKAIAKTNRAAIIINPIANCAYPALDERFAEEDLWKGPVHPSVYAYGGVKRFLLMLAKTYEMQYGIKSIQLPVPNMYGPYDSTDPNKAHALNALVSRFVKAHHTGANEITLWGTGVAIREWLYAGDFGKIILKIMEEPGKKEFSEPLNIAQNTGLSVKELVDVIQSHFDHAFTVKWDASMPDGTPKKVMDDTRFKKTFPDFIFNDFNSGIKETISYYQSVCPY